MLKSPSQKPKCDFKVNHVCTNNDKLVSSLFHSIGNVELRLINMHGKPFRRIWQELQMLFQLRPGSSRRPVRRGDRKMAPECRHQENGFARPQLWRLPLGGLRTQASGQRAAPHPGRPMGSSGETCRHCSEVMHKHKNRIFGNLWTSNLGKIWGASK